MTTEQKDNGTLGQKLAEKSALMGDKLAVKTLDKYWDKLVPLMEAASEEGRTFIEVAITCPPFDYDQVNDIKSCAFYKNLVAKFQSEKLTHTVLWYHPDCSYCENCGSGCRANKIKISWS